MSIGDSLKQIRKDKGLRQIDVAKELEISQSYISLVENNQTIPNNRFLKLFCLQFGVDKDSLH